MTEPFSSDFRHASGAKTGWFRRGGFGRVGRVVGVQTNGKQPEDIGRYPHESGKSRGNGYEEGTNTSVTSLTETGSA